MSPPQIIVLTPVRNEAWILDRFIRCTSLWADHIIIADQLSDDGSADLARSYGNVTVVENDNPQYSEADRQNLLLKTARLIPAPRVLIALDADEILSANVIDSPEWKTALQMPPGTVLEFAKVDLYNSPAEYFLHSGEDRNAWLPFGYVDDDAEHTAEVIHTDRVPVGQGKKSLRFKEVVLLHYNQCNLPRMESKDRWYRCFARILHPDMNVVEIHRLHDWYERLKFKFRVRQSPDEWFQNYRAAGIELSSIQIEPFFWSDWEILRMFERYGTEKFRGVDVWSVDWEALRRIGIEKGVSGIPQTPIQSPLRRRDRWLRAALKRTQYYRVRPYTDKLLKRIVDM